MPDVLEDILAARRRHLDADRQKVPFSDLARKALAAPAPLNFKAAVTKPGTVAVIAEMKRKSPSAGLLRENYDVAEIARAYEKGNASALSVLTEPDRFDGAVGDLDKVRAACRLPILRKDFIFDPYQVVEARVHGADAVLLIADMLNAHALDDLVDCCRRYDVEPLVEVFTPEAMKTAVNSGASLIGINTRNLRTLEMVPDNVQRLSPLIPKDRFIIAESGVKTAQDVQRLKTARVSAVLVGESLMKQQDLEAAVRALAEAGK